jgi:peptidoglycan/xylan/chitin deacetylase (PgdA/CDA1 family)
MNVISILAASFALAIVIYLVFPMLVLRLVRRGQARRLRRLGSIACLTFDDGPDPESTPGVLDALAAHGAHATFFVLGQKARMFPQLVTAILKAGHEIGLHGHSHLHPWKSLPWEYLADLCRGERTLRELVRSRGHAMYRPTFGKGNLLTLIHLLVSRRRAAFWNVDPHDYREQSWRRIVDSTLAAARENPGGVIVLLHDGRTARREQGKEELAHGIGVLCGELAAKGYAFMTVGEALGRAKRDS